MNETLEQQIRRLEFCRNCIVLDYDAGKEEYNRLEMVIEELKKNMNKIKKTGIPKTRKVLMTVEEYQAVLLGLSEIEATTGYGNLQEKDISRYKEAETSLRSLSVNSQQQKRSVMETINLTKKEKEWIKELKVLIRKKPKSLILFADGDLNILKGTKENPSCETEDGRMDKERVADSILFACEGGGF